MLFFRAFQHLLPSGAAWSLTVNKQLRQFFEGLSEGPADLIEFSEDCYFDVFPDTTRKLDDWEEQFFLSGVGLSEAQRRDRLAETWREVGGQSPAYIETLLAAHGFPDLRVHGWVDPAFMPDAQGRYVARDPRLYLTETGVADPGGVVPVAQEAYRPARYTVETGESEGFCGVTVAQCGNGPTPVNVQAGKGYLLVNETPQASNPFRYIFECGEAAANCGNPAAQMGEFAGSRGVQPLRLYELPDDNDYWPYFTYIGPSIFGQLAQYPAARKVELDRLLYRVVPEHLWIGVMVEYT